MNNSINRSSKTASWVRRLKKYHKWPGIFIAFFAFLLALSGIILNHRDQISSVDLPRNWMPPGYQYRNWNLGGLRSSLIVGKDSMLLYGNIGAWLCTAESSVIHDFNNGFPEGIDKRKIYSVVKFKGFLVAGTHFGVFIRPNRGEKWESFNLPKGEERISDLCVNGDSLLILTRDHLFCTTDLIKSEPIDLPQPEGYDRKVGLFLTLWQLHSGELLGMPGKLFVDLLGFVLVFLSLTGLFHFLFPKWISRLKRNGKSHAVQLAAKKWNLKWHNLIGYIFVIFLLANTTAGMFLRPPLLIPISSSRIGILPLSHLDTGNPWQDKLRRIAWSNNLQCYLIYTSDGFYFEDKKFKNELTYCTSQPMVSIMGCNVLKQLEPEAWLVGSFGGLFVWKPATGMVVDYFSGLPATIPHGIGRPVGQNMVAGFVTDCNGRSYWVDYNTGAHATDNGTPRMAMSSEIIAKSPISLWNAALEVHTGRIFEHLIGPFFLLYVPIIGLVLLMVLISGLFIWWLGYRKR